MSRVTQSRAGNGALRSLLSDVYPGSLAPEHLADLRKSGLTDETILLHHIRSVPLPMISRLLGWDSQRIRSAYVIPYPEPPAGVFGNFFQLRIFPPLTRNGHGTLKYAQPRNSGAKLFFCLSTLAETLAGHRPVWIVEGSKKALAVAQLGFPAVGFNGVENWHLRGSRELLPDFDYLHLQGRVIELVPDGDWRTNPDVRLGTERFAQALEVRGARPRLVVLPDEMGA